MAPPTSPEPTERVFLTLGSNIDPQYHLPEAVRRLAERLELVATSHVYESAAVGGPPEAPPFLNAAVEIRTALPPAELKHGLLRPLEAEMGRVRTDDRNAPRQLDVDLALYGDRIVDDPTRKLHLPDPDLLRFAHVALPLADLAPDLRHPVTGQTLRDLADQLSDPETIRVCGDCQLKTEKSRF